jgi:hypothetical protein
MICKTEKAAVTLSKEFFLGCNKNMEEEINRLTEIQSEKKNILARNTYNDSFEHFYLLNYFLKKWVKMINIK